MKSNNSFTLIELLVVISILSLLILIIFSGMRGTTDRARIAKTLQYQASLHRNLGADIVGWWQFDEGDGTTVKDISGYENDGEMQGSPQWVDGVPGTHEHALEFDGSDGVLLGNPSALQITGDKTISFWIKPASLDDRRNPYAKAYGGEGTITQEPSGRLNYYYGTCGGNCHPYQGFSMTNNVEVDEWSYIVLVRDLTNMELRWYKNGEQTNKTNANYGSAEKSSLNAYIGRGYVRRYNGLIDDVRIYSRALTAKEIEKIYVNTGNKYLTEK